MTAPPATVVVRGSRLAFICLAVALATTIALVAWTLAPALRRGDWRWGALGLDTVALLCALAACRRPALTRPGPELLTAAAAAAAYGLAVLSALQDAHSISFVTAGLVSLSTVFVGLLSGAVADIDGSRSWPRAVVPVAVAAFGAAVVIHGLLDGWTTDAYAVGVAVLIAGAPTALAVAVLAPLYLGSRLGGTAGIRIVHTSAITVSERIRALVLDGLATVVDGKHVESVDPLDESHLRNLRWFAGALEHAATDPVGSAIAKLSGRGNLADIEEHPGLGISGSVDRHPVRVGEPTWVGLTPVEGPGVTVAVEVDGRPLGTITVMDTLRPTAPAAVATLRRDGVEPVLVSAAPTLAVRRIADQAGITAVVDRAGTGTDVLTGRIRSEDAVALLSPAVPTTDVDLLLGPTSTQIALEQCDIHNGALALQVARWIARTTRLATGVALGLQALVLLLALVGLLPPWASAIGSLVAGAATWALVSRSRGRPTHGQSP